MDGRVMDEASWTNKLLVFFVFFAFAHGSGAWTGTQWPQLNTMLQRLRSAMPDDSYMDMVSWKRRQARGVGSFLHFALHLLGAAVLAACLLMLWDDMPHDRVAPPPPTAAAAAGTETPPPTPLPTAPPPERSIGYSHSGFALFVLICVVDIGICLRAIALQGRRSYYLMLASLVLVLLVSVAATVIIAVAVDEGDMSKENFAIVALLVVFDAIFAYFFRVGTQISRVQLDEVDLGHLQRTSLGNYYEKKKKEEGGGGAAAAAVELQGIE